MMRFVFLKYIYSQLTSTLFCKGEDARAVEPNRPIKSISVAVNWGIRMTRDDEVERFLHALAPWVARRLAAENRTAHCVRFAISHFSTIVTNFLTYFCIICFPKTGATEFKSEASRRNR